MKRRVILWAFAAGTVLCATTAAQAQLSSAQQGALKANCRSDFMSHCSGVTPGGRDALTCLQKNVDGLSGACQAAVRATMPAPAAAAKPEPVPQTMTAAPPAPAAAPPPPAPAAAPATAAAPPPPAPPKVKVAAPPPAAPRPAAAATMAAPTAAQQSAMRAACRNDFMAKCAGVQPGGRDALTCLQRHVATLSASCKSVVAATMGGAPAAKPAAAAAVAVPAAPPPAAAIDPAKLKALKFTCRGDFRRLCKNVPQGPEAFACLQAHSARLSPNCRTSVADLAASIPEGAAMPAPTPAAIKPAPVPHPPKAPMIDAAVVLRACKLDLIRHCRGAGVGGGKVMACLTAHEADLTFRCRTAMKVTSPLH